mgnify:CR=1 FL=1
MGIKEMKTIYRFPAIEHDMLYVWVMLGTVIFPLRNYVSRSTAESLRLQNGYAELIFESAAVRYEQGSTGYSPTDSLPSTVTAWKGLFSITIY